MELFKGNVSLFFTVEELIKFIEHDITDEIIEIIVLLSALEIDEDGGLEINEKDCGIIHERDKRRYIDGV